MTVTRPSGDAKQAAARPGFGGLLRCRFDSFEQLARHLHVVDNAALLFVRHEQPAAGRVLLELVIRESAQQTVARGAVVARAEGALPGLWVQLADLRLARRLREPGGLAQRREERVSADALVELRTSPGRQLVAQLLDLSSGGLRVRVAGGLAVDEVHLVRVLGLPAAKAELGLARVMRVERGEASLRFALARGPQVLSYLGDLREAWRAAADVPHLSGCCGARGVLEPSLPRTRKSGER